MLFAVYAILPCKVQVAFPLHSKKELRGKQFFEKETGGGGRVMKPHLCITFSPLLHFVKLKKKRVGESVEDKLH